MSDDKKPVEIWVTKYALSRGVFHHGAAEISDNGNMASSGRYPGRYLQHYHGEDWHRTKEAAEARVQVMIDRKRASIIKELAKLTKLEAGPMKVTEWAEVSMPSGKASE